MKITIDPRVLADAVAWASRSLAQKPSMPVLSGLMLEAAADGTLEISAFDYDLSARVRLGADVVEVAEPGKALVPGRVLVEVTKRLPDRFAAELTAMAADVTLSCGPAEFGLPALSVETYPNLPDPPATVGTVDGEVFARAVSQVAPAVDPHSAEPMLTGIRLDIAGRRVTLAASDTAVLAVRDVEWDAPADASAEEVLIPGASLHGIAETLSGPAEIGIGDGQIAITAGGRQSILRRLDVRCRDYRRYAAAVVRGVTAQAEVAPLLEAIDRVSVMAEKNTATKLIFGGGAVEVRAGGGSGGKGREVLPAILEGVDAAELRFLPHVIRNALAGVGDPVVRLSMSLPTKPVHIVGIDSEGNENAAYQAVVMPLRDV